MAEYRQVVAQRGGEHVAVVRCGRISTSSKTSAEYKIEEPSTYALLCGFEYTYFVSFFVSRICGHFFGK